MYAGIWLGATDNQSEGIWIWNSSGSALTYTNWSLGDPDNQGGNENCLHMWHNLGEWNNGNCEYSLADMGTLCEQIFNCS